jgi:hypothetical protein
MRLSIKWGCFGLYFQLDRRNHARAQLEEQTLSTIDDNDQYFYEREECSCRFEGLG